MSNPQEWLHDGLDEPAQERYKYFMRPEPHDGMGPIEKEFDVYTMRELRTRMIDVSMTRNSSSAKPYKVYLDPLPHIRIPRAKPLQGWYKGKNDYREGRRPRPCFTDAVLTEPYGGYCTVGCSMCYINSGARGYRGSGLITVPMAYGNQVRDMLAEMNTANAGYFSSFTDPFLPLEEMYHNTQQGATAFVNEGLPIFFLSRLSYPGWAFDLLKRNSYSYAQKSLNTGVDEDYRRFSPGALSLAEHIEEIRQLRKNRIYTSIQVNPIVAGITTHDHIEALFHRLAEVGNNHVIVKFVEAAYSWVPAMIERHRKRFGAERAQAFADLFTQNIGGQRTINEEYRLSAHRRYRALATKLGMTYVTCYEYKQVGDSKLGVSVGREFTTADQCHGHRVPMFTRVHPGAPFSEVSECPPTGCLYCADENETGTPRCGNPVMGDARALRMPDLKQPVYEDVFGFKRIIPIKKA